MGIHSMNSRAIGRDLFDSTNSKAVEGKTSHSPCLGPGAAMAVVRLLLLSSFFFGKKRCTWATLIIYAGYTTPPPHHHFFPKAGHIKKKYMGYTFFHLWVTFSTLLTNSYAKEVCGTMY